MNTYELHWLDGKVETLKGDSVFDAYTKAGYGLGAVQALDYYREINALAENNSDG
jgi:hypothetical protein